MAKTMQAAAENQLNSRQSDQNGIFHPWPNQYQLLIDFVRWGPDLTKDSHAGFKVMLFHLERTATWRKETDAHSISQATTGVCSRTAVAVRGSAGVSPASYKRANRELIALGWLKTERKQHSSGKDAPTEYTPDFAALWRAIETLKRKAEDVAREAADQRVIPIRPDVPSTISGDFSSSQRATPVAHGEPPTTGNKTITCRAEQASERSNSNHSSSSNLRNQRRPPARFPSPDERKTAQTIQTATGCPVSPTDPLCETLLKRAAEAGGSPDTLIEWIQQKTEQKRIQSDPIRSPGFFLETINADFGPWLAMRGSPDTEPWLRDCPRCGQRTLEPTGRTTAECRNEKCFYRHGQY